ncbi:MAG TPA: hypothetical protein VNJ07_08335 [Chitinophagales bacterium]|nr:hypothetical protein [Chitinophagales bacterium]
MGNKLVSLLSTPDQWLRTVLTTMLFYVLTFLVFGCYYEVYEAFLEASYSGKLSPGYPFRSLYFLADIGISYFYAALYSITNKVEWHTWFLSFYTLLSAVLTLKTAADILKDKISGWMLFFIQMGIFWLVLAEHITHFNYTRPATMLAASSLLALTYYFPDAGSIAKNKGKFVALNLLFLLSALTRIETALAVTALSFCYAVFFENGFLHGLRLFLFPFIVMFSLVAGVYVDIANSPELYKQIEPDLEYQMSARGITMPPGTHTYADTVKFRAAEERLWSDPKIITVDYLRSLVVTSNKLPLVDATQWCEAAKCVFSVAANNYPLVLFSLTILLLAFFSGSDKKKIIGFTAFQCCYWVIVFIQSYSVRINDRVFSIFLSAYILFNIIGFLVITRGRPVKQVHYFFMLILLTAAFHWKSMSKNLRFLADDRANSIANLNEIRKVAGGKVLVVNASSFRGILSTRTPLLPIDVSGFKKFYMNENQAVALMHPFREYLENECQCDVTNFSNFYRYLQSLDEDVFILSTEHRLMLTQEYLKYFHDFNLQFEEVESIDLREVTDHDVGNRVTLKLYRLRKD